jgi:hypothetical protein
LSIRIIVKQNRQGSLRGAARRQGRPTHVGILRALAGTSAYSRAGVQSASGAEGENMKSHKPPKQDKKKPLLSPKEKKAIKQQKKHAGDAAPLIRH